MGYQETTGSGAAPNPSAGVGDLVIGAADGDPRAWEQLTTGLSGLVSSIIAAHRLQEGDSAQIHSAVWRRLGHNLGRIRQPDLVGAWVAAVARDECVKILAADIGAAAQSAA